MSNDYFIRCRQQDVPGLYALATALGVLTPALDMEGQPTGAYTLAPGQVGAWDVVGAVSRPTGEVILGEPYEQPEMVEVVTQVPHEFMPEVMVEVRTWEPTGKTNTVTPETKATAPVLDEDGVPYWHANLRLEASLMEIAQAKALENPAVGRRAVQPGALVRDGRGRPGRRAQRTVSSMALNKERPVADDTHQRKRLTFDPTINAGHVLTFIAMCICILTSWNLLDKRITVVEQAQAFQRERDQNQDNTAAGKFGEVKEVLNKIDRAIDDMRRDQLNQQRKAP